MNLEVFLKKNEGSYGCEMNILVMSLWLMVRLKLLVNASDRKLNLYFLKLSFLCILSISIYSIQVKNKFTNKCIH